MRVTKHRIWQHPDGRTIPVSMGKRAVYLSPEQEREYNRIRRAP